MQFPIRTTKRLKLESLNKNDVKTLFDIFSDPQVIEKYDVEQFTQIEEASELIDYFDARFESDTGIRWAIRLKSTGKMIGTCGFTHWNKYDHSAVIGYELCPKFWGKGYATEALTEICNFIFSSEFHFYVHRIEALILPINTPSKVLVEKIGFKPEGILRGKCYWNNDFHDMQMFGLLRTDLRK